MKGRLVPALVGIYALLLIGVVVNSGYSALLTATVIGLVTGSAYAVASSGLVITYATSNVFNMAHGSIGMLGAFLYWELSVNRGWPEILALLFVVGIAAPLFGALLERGLMRRLTTATVTAQLTVTVGLFIMLIGVGRTIWPPGTQSQVPSFFEGNAIELGGVRVTFHELTVFLAGAALAGGLYVLLNRTRIGIAMRAIVDNRDLLALHGARPQLLGMVSWGLGSSLAALAGILLVPALGLDHTLLTLVVINAFAAAMVGRLKSLPRTFVGAILLGLLIEQSNLFFGLFPDSILESQNELFNGLRAALPTLFLLATMLLLPQDKLRVGVVEGAILPRLPSRTQSLAWGAVLVGAVAIVVQFLGRSNQASLGAGLAYATVMLSLVVLTGYGGDASLAQMTFVGIGALVVLLDVSWVPWLNTSLNIGSAITAGIIAAIAGVVIAFPALRLRGLYIGLGTLAIASGFDELLFKSRAGFGTGGIKLVERPPGFTSEGNMAILTAIVFVLLALVVLAIRGGRFGRLLLATRDSPAACGTLGLSITRTRVQAFALSAGLAGFAGAVFTGMLVSVGSDTVQMLRSLPLLLLAAVGGITSITGVFIGGMFLGAGPALQQALPGSDGGGLVVRLLQDDFFVIGLLSLFATNPLGVARFLFRLDPRKRWRRPVTATKPCPSPASERADETEEVSVVAVP